MDENSSRAYEEVRPRINRLVELYNRLEGIPFDVGGDVLFPSELNMIEAIGKRGDGTVTGLAAAFGVTKGAVSQTVGKLAGKGYITKQRSTLRGKEVELGLTDKGSSVFKRHESFHKLMDMELNESMKGFTKEQIEEFIHMLDLVCRYMEKFIFLKEWKL